MANFERKGKIILNVQTFDDSRALDFIKHNEWEWQKVQKIKFKGKSLASGIERILWFCPKCHAFKSISSNGNKAICKNCNSSFIVDEFGYINNQTVEKILKEQVEILDKRFKEINTIKNVKIIIRDKKTNKLHAIKKGDLLISNTGLSVNNLYLEFSHIKGVTTFLKKFTEFIYNSNYVVRIKSENESLLLYHILRRYLHVYSNS